MSYLLYLPFVIFLPIILILFIQILILLKEYKRRKNRIPSKEILNYINFVDHSMLYKKITELK